jgi:hypothetical protein
VVTICDEITDSSDGTLRVICYLLSVIGKEEATARRKEQKSRIILLEVLDFRWLI